MGKAGAITRTRDEEEAAGHVCLLPERVCPGNSTQTPSPITNTHYHAMCGLQVIRCHFIFIQAFSPYSHSESSRWPAQWQVWSGTSDWSLAAPWQASDGRAALRFPV